MYKVQQNHAFQTTQMPTVAHCPARRLFSNPHIGPCLNARQTQQPKKKGQHAQGNANIAVNLGFTSFGLVETLLLVFGR